MFSLQTMTVLITIMSFIQISIWQIFPIRFRDILFSNTALAFLVNLGGSSLILTFTGVASIVGVSNLGASVVFGFYA